MNQLNNFKNKIYQMNLSQQDSRYINSTSESKW